MKTKRHKVKCWVHFFPSVWNNLKRFEVRKNDRDYKVGEILEQHEWDPISGEYTGRRLASTILYMMEGGHFGVEKGFCVLSLSEPFNRHTGCGPLAHAIDFIYGDD